MLLGILSSLVIIIAVHGSPTPSTLALKSNTNTTIAPSNRWRPSPELLDVPAYRNTTVGTNDDMQQINPATLIVCNGIGCDTVIEICEAFDLLEVSRGVCFPTIPFLSVMILQPAGGGFPLPVLIGPPGCEELDQIPVVNQCFDLDPEGPAFGDFLVAD